MRTSTTATLWRATRVAMRTGAANYVPSQATTPPSAPNVCPAKSVRLSCAFVVITSAFVVHAGVTCLVLVTACADEGTCCEL